MSTGPHEDALNRLRPRRGRGGASTKHGVAAAFAAAAVSAGSAMAQSGVVDDTPAGRSPSEVVMRTRVPAVLVVLTAGGRPLSAPLSALLEAANGALRHRTDLEVRSPEQTGVDVGRLARCRARRRLTCWTRALQAGGSPDRPAPALAFVVIGRPVDAERDQLNLVLLDVAGASRRLAAAARPEDLDRIEDRVFRASVHAPARVVASARPGTLRRYFDDVADHLQPRLAELNRWWPSGTVRVVGAPTGLAVEIDRFAAGTSGAPVGPVKAGLREVGVYGPEDHSVLEMVAVPAGGEVTLRWTPPPADLHTARAITRWVGLGAALTGAAIAGFGWASADDVETTCIVRAGAPDCPSVGPVTFGFNPGGAPSLDPADVNPSGVQLTSLGLALMTSGVAWSVGSWLWGPDDAPPWWTWLAGALIGGATYGIAVAAQGG